MAEPLVPLPTASKTALLCRTRQDYISAMLAYDEVLRKDPFNHREMKKLVACHEAMLAADHAAEVEKQSTTMASLDAERQELPDLPDLAPESDPHQLAQKP